VPLSSVPGALEPQVFSFLAPGPRPSSRRQCPQLTSPTRIVRLACRGASPRPPRGVGGTASTPLGSLIDLLVLPLTPAPAPLHLAFSPHRHPFEFEKPTSLPQSSEPLYSITSSHRPGLPQPSVVFHGPDCLSFIASGDHLSCLPRRLRCTSASTWPSAFTVHLTSPFVWGRPWRGGCGSGPPLPDPPSRAYPNLGRPSGGRPRRPGSRRPPATSRLSVALETRRGLSTLNSSRGWKTEPSLSCFRPVLVADTSCPPSFLQSRPGSKHRDPPRGCSRRYALYSTQGSSSPALPRPARSRPRMRRWKFRSGRSFQVGHPVVVGDP